MSAQVISLAAARGRMFKEREISRLAEGKAPASLRDPVSAQLADIELACIEQAIRIDQKQLSALRTKLDEMDPRCDRIGAVQSRIEQLQVRLLWCHERLLDLTRPD